MQIKTELDTFMELVRNRGKVQLDDVSEELSYPSHMVLEWAEILEEKGIIRITYELTKTYFEWVGEGVIESALPPRVPKKEEVIEKKKLKATEKSSRGEVKKKGDAQRLSAAELIEIKRQAKHLSETFEELQRKNSELERKISEEISTWKEKEKLLRTTLQTSQQSVTQLEKTITELKVRGKELSDEREQLLASIQNAQRQHTTLQNELARISQEIESLTPTLHKKRETLQELTRALSNYTQQEEDLRARIDQLNRQRADQEKLLSQHQDSYHQQSLHLQALTTKLSEIRAAIETTEQHIAELQSTLNGPYKEKEKALIEEIEKAFQRIVEREKQLFTLSENERQLAHQILAQENKIHELLTQKTEKETRFRELEEELTTLDHILGHQRAELEKRAQALRTSIQELEEKIRRDSAYEAELKKKEEQLRTMQQTMEQMEAHVLHLLEKRTKILETLSAHEQLGKDIVQKFLSIEQSLLDAETHLVLLRERIATLPSLSFTPDPSLPPSPPVRELPHPSSPPSSLSGPSSHTFTPKSDASPSLSSAVPSQDISFSEPHQPPSHSVSPKNRRDIYLKLQHLVETLETQSNLPPETIIIDTETEKTSIDAVHCVRVLDTPLEDPYALLRKLSPYSFSLIHDFSTRESFLLTNGISLQQLREIFSPHRITAVPIRTFKTKNAQRFSFSPFSSTSFSPSTLSSFFASLQGKDCVLVISFIPVSQEEVLQEKNRVYASVPSSLHSLIPWISPLLPSQTRDVMLSSIRMFGEAEKTNDSFVRVTCALSGKDATEVGEVFSQTFPVFPTKEPLSEALLSYGIIREGGTILSLASASSLLSFLPYHIIPQEPSTTSV